MADGVCKLCSSCNLGACDVIGNVVKLAWWNSLRTIKAIQKIFVATNDPSNINWFSGV